MVQDIFSDLGVARWVSGVVHSKREDSQNLLVELIDESRLPNTRDWGELRMVHCGVEVLVICRDSFNESAQGLGDIFIIPCFL